MTTTPLLADSEPTTSTLFMNIADRLRQTARQVPDQAAIIIPPHRFRAEKSITFAELDNLCDRLATGFAQLDIGPGRRIALMVRPGIEFIALTFALFRGGATIVLIDPGMGIRRFTACLEEVDPHGFVAIPLVHIVRQFQKRRFRDATRNVCVGRNWHRDAASYRNLERTSPNPASLPQVAATDPAAIIFTSGGTGTPKGVLYEHGMFAAQADLLQRQFQIQPGEIDLPGFPLFALFNAAMAVTTVIPHIDPTRPARVDPRRILDPIRRYQVTQAFGSPALWNRVGRHCEQHGEKIPHLKRALSAGAPVPLHVLQRMQSALQAPGGALHTPYGATEALPVAVLDAPTILAETASASRQGAGTCVGFPFPQIDVKIIARTDHPLANLSEATLLPPGEIGEIIVRGPSVTRQYFNRPEATALAKIADGDTFWHRMGDMGYLDSQGRLWFCGRKAHVVLTSDGPMYSVPCEAIFNNHPRVYRSALVGVGLREQQTPIIVVELESTARIKNEMDQKSLIQELSALAQQNRLTSNIKTFLIHDNFPVDIRHNIKINREQLAQWAASQ